MFSFLHAFMTRRTNGIIAHICGHFQLENLVYFKGFAFPGNSREFPGNRCSREVIPGNLGFGNMLNPNTDRHTDIHTYIHTDRQTELKYYIRYFDLWLFFLNSKNTNFLYE